MNQSIVVIGSSNTDFIMKMENLPKRGETVTNATFMQTFGGKGANQAVGAARAGAQVTFVNCVGEDPFGAQIIQNMRAEGINSDFIFQQSGAASGSALVMIDANGENYLSVAPGANYSLTPDFLEQARPAVEQAAMVVLQYEVLPETLYAAIDMADQLGKPVLFNLAPLRPFDPAYLKKIGVLVVNEVEAEMLCGYPVHAGKTDVEAALDIRAKGAECVVITLGSQGALLSSPEVQFHLPAFPVSVVDTTAAGDVFCGSLAAALVVGQELKQAARFASAAAAIAVTRLGAQPSAPYRSEIDAFLAAH